MPEPTAKVVHYTDVAAKKFGSEAPGVSIRWLIDEEHDGAPTYALRVIEVEAGSATPDHTHPFEHENFVIQGTGKVRLGDEWHPVAVGDVIFVPAGLQHTYVNTGDDVFKFLCGIPATRLLPK